MYQSEAEGGKKTHNSSTSEEQEESSSKENNYIHSPKPVFPGEKSKRRSRRLSLKTVEVEEERKVRSSKNEGTKRGLEREENCEEKQQQEAGKR